MAKITFQDKIPIRDLIIPRWNAVTAEDLNEIKESVNFLYDNPTGGESIYSADGAITEDRVLDLAGNQITFKGIGDQAVLRLKESRSFFIGGLANYIASKDTDVGYVNNHIYSADSNWVFWGATGNGWVHVGDHLSHTPNARLQVTAQGFFSTDRVFSVREPNRINDIFLVTGDERVSFDLKSASTFESAFTVDVNNQNRVQFLQNSTWFRKPVYFEQITAFGSNDIPLTSQSGGGNSMILSPYTGSIFVKGDVDGTPEPSAQGIYFYVKRNGDKRLPAFINSDGHEIRLFSSDNIEEPTGGSNIDSECRSTVVRILDLLKDNGMMLN